ncbi:Uncharacterized membrane protein YhhN [Fontimonas thermophila]|uniref:Uncharacterized membrane protein YhhN n=1 Tax=Fontimonas thermophila TaxID=1076937 RepID=A0A1I2H1S6_9GAMM|nr:lysoplasmalogenase [Fontimonas thermophila]SFF24045.1 Uncharacterized membrane protein YhhN [Fontimonas thermophila]
MLTMLGGAAAASAFAAIVADWNESRPKVFYLLKPLTTILIAAIAAQAPASAYRDWLLAGLVLSLLGDIFLMFDRTAFFIGGLASFLLAHLVFMWAFVHGLSAPVLPPWAWGFVAYGVVFAAILLPRAGALKLPVLVYGAVLTAMAVTAAMRAATLGDTGARLALAGAVLFVLSDSALGARKFIAPYPGAQGLILSTYWAAIGLIAASALYVAA